MVFKNRMGAYGVHLTREGLIGFAWSLFWTAMMVYQIQIVGLTPLQLVLVGTTMEVTVFLFEIPTGIVSDVFSRRLSVIIGFVMLGVGYLIQVIPAFVALIVGNIVWGIGYTFTSGAYDAWLVDELGQDNVGKAFLRGGQFGRIGSIAGIITAAVLGSVDLQLPLLIGGILTIVNGIFMLLFMPENGFQPTPREDRSTFGKMIDTFRDGVKVVRKRPALLRILGVGIFFGLFSEGWDRLWQAQLLRTFDLGNDPNISPVVLVAVLDITMMAIIAVAAEVLRRRVDLNNPRQVTRALFALTAFMVAGIVVFGLAPTLAVALIAFGVFNLGRGLVDPLLRTWTNSNIDSDVRATVLSMQSQTDAIGQTLGGPPIGAVGQLSIRAALVVSGLILSPALWLLHRAGRAEQRNHIEQEAVAEGEFETASDRI